MNDGHPLLSEVLPEFHVELAAVLRVAGEYALADGLGLVRFHDWCDCGDDRCQSFRTAPEPEGAYGAGHRLVSLAAEDGTAIHVDVVDGFVVFVEIRDRPKLRIRFRAG
ncbi:hypothetical protein [Embleya sp. NPDC050493]|uniref:hypothetical protein n=1 Tax=Embleya sp. NPDC050493 TaxID=3363989 RepID=UPI0037A12907